MIRPYRSEDLPALYRICLLTGDAGADASALYREPELLGHYYAAPYGVFEPRLCFVVAAEGDPVGYILGTEDTATFHDRAEREWFPALRTRFPLPAIDDTSPDAALIRSIHSGYSWEPELARFPAHLHIDLLPCAQGRGLGRQLLDRFCAALQERGVSAAHLGVSVRNHRAIAFYERYGFRLIRAYPEWRAYGLALAPTARATGAV